MVSARKNVTIRDMARRSSGSSAAHAELKRALAAHGPARVERLVTLSHDHPDFAPVWVALAEHHWNAGRTEEALQAARRALRIDPSAHGDFSAGLSGATRSLLPKKSASPPLEPPPDLTSRPLTGSVKDTARPMGRPTPSGPADKALQQASILVGFRRRERLEELSKEYPDHAPILLALAEETLVQRSVEQAMVAAERAMSQDPSLEAMMSPPMARAWKYHKIERRISETPSPARGNAGAERGSSSPAVPPGGPRKPYQRAGAGVAKSPEPAPASTPKAPHSTSPRLNKMLKTALGLRSRIERITILEQLASMDPDNPRVLFHLAKELSLEGKMEDARKRGDALRDVSPELYTELYEWAATHWANQQNSASSPQPTNAASPTSQPAPSPRRASIPRPVSTPVAPLHKAPRGSRPPQHAQHPPRPSQIPNPALRQPRPLSALHDLEEDVEPTMKVARVDELKPAADEVDHSKENAQFKTMVMHLSEVQRLADETRPDEPKTARPAVPVPPNVAPTPALSNQPAPTEIDFGGPPAHVVSARGKRPQNVPGDRPGVHRSPTSDTHVQPAPLHRPRPATTPPDTELQLRRPAGAVSATDAMGIEDILGDDGASSMPSWLQSPTPWARQNSPSSTDLGRASSAPRAVSPIPTNPPGTTRRAPSGRQDADDPRQQTDGPRPRAHPRLVRRTPQSAKDTGPADDPG